MILLEQWKPVAGYEDRYEVSNTGRVRRVKPTRQRGKGSLLTQWPDVGGYPYVSLWHNNKRSNAKVHKLMAIAFLGEPKPNMQVNHIDGDKTNNHLSNLEWVTSSTNLRHAYKLGLKQPTRGERHGNVALSEEKVHWIRHNRKQMTAAAMARQLGVTRPTVRNVLIGVNWQWLKEKHHD